MSSIIPPASPTDDYASPDIDMSDIVGSTIQKSPWVKPALVPETHYNDSNYAGNSSTKMQFDEDENYEADSSDLEMRRPPAKKPHQPAKPGPWQFVEGTDLSKAEVGKPEPSKFFLVREHRKDPTIKDVRQYVHMENFDWNDPLDVELLNKHRRQVRERTIGNISTPRPAWTEAEKNYLKKQIELGISYGYTKSNMPWERVTNNLNWHFAHHLQPADSPLARTSRLIKGEVVYPQSKKKTEKLKFDRTTSERTLTAVVNQASKFADILKLLNESERPPKFDTKRKLVIRCVDSTEIEGVSSPAIEQESDDKDEGTEESAAKKQKIM